MPRKFLSQHFATILDLIMVLIAWSICALFGRFASWTVVSVVFVPVLLWQPFREAEQSLARVGLNLVRRSAIATVALLVVSLFGMVPRADRWLAELWCGIALLSDLCRYVGIRVLPAGWSREVFRRVVLVVARFQEVWGELAVLAVVLTLARNFWSQCWPSGRFLFIFGILWAPCAAVVSVTAKRSYSAVLSIRLILAFIVAGVALRAQGITLQRGHLAVAIFCLILFGVRSLVAYRLSDGSEARSERLRLALAMLFAFWVIEPIAYPVLHGSGDALWYGTMMADMIAQVRAGVFPVFGGQSIYQFNGAMYPIRIAPAFHYLGAAFDTVTLRTLGAFGVQNLMIASWGMLAGITAYVALSRLAPSRRWIAVVGSFLFVACPGVMSIAYYTDLYMSWTTVPFVPLALVATVLSFKTPTPNVLLLLGTSLGVLWWGHAPIALWTSLIVIAATLMSWVAKRKIPRPFFSYALGGLVCIAIGNGEGPVEAAGRCSNDGDRLAGLEEIVW